MTRINLPLSYQAAIESLDPNIQRVAFEYKKLDMYQISTVPVLRDGPLENLWGGGGETKYKQNIRAREK